MTSAEQVAASRARSGWARWRGACRPALAALALVLLLALLDLMVGLDRAVLPRPTPQQLALEGYPKALSLKDAAAVVDAAMWWLCLSFLLWTVGLSALALCWRTLYAATRNAPALWRTVRGLFRLAVLLVVAPLVVLAAATDTPLMSFGFFVDRLGVVSSGLLRLATFNTGWVFVVGAVLLLSASLLLLPGAFGDHPMQQMRAITRLMYGGALFLLVWTSAATCMYRLCAMLMAPEARDAALKLAPTISLMAGLFLSLLMAASYLAATAWLQDCHERRLLLGPPEPTSADNASPQSLLLAHWPKVFALLMPLLPGAIGSVLQAVAHAP